MRQTKARKTVYSPRMKLGRKRGFQDEDMSMAGKTAHANGWRANAKEKEQWRISA